MRFQREVTRVEEADDGTGNIPLERLGAGRQEERVVLAPHRQQRRPVRAEVFLERRVQRDIAGIIEAQVELETATSLAAAAAVSAPANSPQSVVNAQDTWRGTLHQYVYLRPGTLSQSCGAYQPGQTVVCTGTATLDYGQTPMGLIVPGPPIQLSSTATARGSPYRST